MKARRIVVYPSDFQRWFDIKEAASSRKYRHARESLHLEKDQPLTVMHLSGLWKVSLEKLIEFLS